MGQQPYRQNRPWNLLDGKQGTDSNESQSDTDTKAWRMASSDAWSQAEQDVAKVRQKFKNEEERVSEEWRQASDYNTSTRKEMALGTLEARIALGNCNCQALISHNAGLKSTLGLS